MCTWYVCLYIWVSLEDCFLEIGQYLTLSRVFSGYGCIPKLCYICTTRCRPACNNFFLMVSFVVSPAKEIRIPPPIWNGALVVSSYTIKILTQTRVHLWMLYLLFLSVKLLISVGYFKEFSVLLPKICCNEVTILFLPVTKCKSTVLSIHSPIYLPTHLSIIYVFMCLCISPSIIYHQFISYIMLTGHFP